VTNPTGRREFNTKTYLIAAVFAAVLGIITLIVVISARIYPALILCVFWGVISVLAFRAARASTH
jgi:hypothetical protein